ncbi:ABC transporter ATP-binding protein [bacterium]|nr:ABC transporter ATP-binding protein [bacterium]
MNESALLKVKNLKIQFDNPSGAPIEVVRGIDLELKRGKTLGIVGESGSGKSMTVLSILGLVPGTGSVSGSIRYQDRELIGLDDKAFESVRGAEISIVFQDPSTALNPVFTIEQQLVETILVHKQVTPEAARLLALEGLRQVEIPDPEQRIKDYAHQLSGGMRQRILIAMALSCEPSCLILDEPTTALDVTVQAQILDLVERIQHFNNTSIILISHDLGIVSEISDEIAVMYAGRIVEHKKTRELLESPQHPYTIGLLNSIPKVGNYKQKMEAIAGFPPNPAQLPKGCAFHPRCERKISQCESQEPQFEGVVACWNPEKAK